MGNKLFFNMLSMCDKTFMEKEVSMENRIMVLWLTIKYWLQGDDWKDAKESAEIIVEKGWM
jgi:hypothetical protein